MNLLGYESNYATETPESLSRYPEIRRYSFSEEFAAGFKSMFMDFGTLGWLYRESTRPPTVGTGVVLPEDLNVPSPDDVLLSEAGIAAPFKPSAELPGGPKALSEDEWKASPYYRKKIPYTPGMTEDRARELAKWSDWREDVDRIASQPESFMGRVGYFLGGLTAGAADPVNFVPLFGIASRARAIAKLGPLLGKMAVTGAEAGLLNAVTEPFHAASLKYEGKDVSFGDIALDVTLGTIIGAAAGGLGHLIGKHIGMKPDEIADAIASDVGRIVDGAERGGVGAADVRSLTEIADRYGRAFDSYMREIRAAMDSPDVSLRRSALLGELMGIARRMNDEGDARGLEILSRYSEVHSNADISRIVSDVTSAFAEPVPIPRPVRGASPLSEPSVTRPEDVDMNGLREEVSQLVESVKAASERGGFVPPDVIEASRPRGRDWIQKAVDVAAECLAD